MKKCKLFLVGNIDHFRDKLDLMRICEEMKISENVLFIPRLSRNNLQNHLQYCDLSISAIPPEGFYRISSPTKVYESLGNGIPVVGPGAKIQVSFCDQDLVSQVHYFWRDVKKEDNIDTILPDTALEKFMKDKLYAR